MAAPLDNIRILDLSAMVTGPMATQMLGDMGADVIKIEPPDIGDVTRYVGASRGGISAWFAGINRSKRSVVIDLKEPDGVDLVCQLATKSDVIIQNFRPGVVERLGVDETSLRAVNNDLIYVSISAYGETGPYAGKPAYDLILQGLAGLADVQRNLQTGEPEFVRQAIIDKITSYTAIQGIIAALLARERGMPGQHVKVSMLDSALSLIWADSMTNQAILGDFERTPDLSKLYRVIKTSDGHVAIAAATEAQVQGLLRAVNRDDLLNDSRFKTLPDVLNNVEAFYEELAFKENIPTSEELIAWLEAEDVPAGPVYERDKVASDPQVKAMEALQDFDHPIIGPLRQPRPPVQFDQTPAAIQRAAPGLGEHTTEVLTDLLGLTKEDVEAFISRGVVQQY